MSEEKTRHKVDEVKGRAKEGVGRTTGDEELEAQGKRDQAKSNVKQAGEKLKDAARDVTKR